MVFRLSEKERLILVIDEYPYVAQAARGPASTLQLLIDKYRDASKMMLILCGSSMSSMEEHVLAYKAPLYDRQTAQIRLLPFDFAESYAFFKGFSAEDKALAYGITGGTPHYLLQMSDRLSIRENIQNTFLNPASSLYEKPMNLLKQEVREPALYTAIITAVAAGSSRMSEISDRVGEKNSVCSTYLKNLMPLGIIKKELPYGENASKKALYVIDDNMPRFWHRFVPENASLISRGAADLVYQRIEPQLFFYMGKVFEEICKQYLWKLLPNGKSPVFFTSLGRWWGSDPIHKHQAEIDIMGEQDKDTALFGECKWTNEKVDLNILETLIKRSNLFSYPEKHFFLFSKSGFTDACAKRANELGHVYLVPFKEMVSGSC